MCSTVVLRIADQGAVGKSRTVSILHVTSAKGVFVAVETVEMAVII